MNWANIRREYYEQCTDNIDGLKKINLTPHNLFEWFKNKLDKKNRSNAQNRSLHLYFNMLCEQLNDAGYTFINTMNIETPYTPNIIKEVYWKPLQFSMFKIESTTKLTTEMINLMIDAFSLHFGEKGIYVEFPNYHTFLNKQDAKYN